MTSMCNRIEMWLRWVGTVLVGVGSVCFSASHVASKQNGASGSDTKTRVCFFPLSILWFFILVLRRPWSLSSETHATNGAQDQSVRDAVRGRWCVKLGYVKFLNTQLRTNGLGKACILPLSGESTCEEWSDESDAQCPIHNHKRPMETRAQEIDLLMKL